MSTPSAVVDNGEVGSVAYMEPTEPPFLVGLVGYARTGKDTVGRILGAHNYTRSAFADPIYRVITGMNPIIEIPGSPNRYRRLNDVLAQHSWSWIKANSPEARRLLNVLGAEVRSLSKTFWVDVTFDGLVPGERTVITDVRTPNEAASVRAHGGVLVRVTRPGFGAGVDPITGIPYWIDIACDDTVVDLTICNDGSAASLTVATARILTLSAARTA